ncbi:MAG: hypothetical protein M3498_17865 [Deinococcota bacterium]|jgi:hypothetical protein|nr:hypothetical protein [Deinococcota bacterium]
MLFASPLSRTLIGLALLLALVPLAGAQTLRFGLEAAPPGLRPLLTASDLDAGWARVTLRLGVTPGRAFEVGAAARRTLTLGPLGNVILDTGADLSTAGEFDLSLQGRGTVATVAARLRLEAFNVGPARFERARAFAEDSRPAYPLAGDHPLGLRLAAGFSYRLDRLLVLAVDPELAWLSGRGFGGGFGAALQFRRLVGQDDGHALVLAGLEPGTGAGFAAAGFEYRLNRAGWPTLRATALIGGGSLGLKPGLRLELSGAAETLSYSLSLAAEPYRVPGPRFLGSLGLSHPLGAGTLDLRLLAAPGSALGSFGANLGYSLEF